MSSISTVRSCTRCHEAKRKCDRATPSCQLCRRKKLECIYPSRRLSIFVPVQTAHQASSCLPPDFTPLDSEAMSNELVTTGPLPNLAPNTAAPEHAITIDSRGSWFLAPETFTVDHTFMPLPPNFKISDLEDFVRFIENCLATWITTGSNIFIHAHLYEDKFPSCLQIAFATFSAYISRTPATTAMILRTVNDQATALISGLEGGTSCDLVDDLAHMHALLAYQVIGLFNGDIRSRHLAEKRAAHLSKLLDRALEHASLTLNRHVSTDDITVSLANPKSPTELLWQSWIMSESLRRTWLVVKGISASYDGLKQGWTPCHGDVMFTACEGFWSANSASFWAKKYADMDMRFVGRFHAEYLFDVAPEGVDEFAKVMLEAIFGRERFMKWVCGLHC